MSVGFADGGVLAPRTIVWATGFTRDFSWIGVPVFDDHGEPVHERGVTSSRGLFFLGLPWQHTRGSALLGFVGDDAEWLSTQLTSSARMDVHS